MDMKIYLIKFVVLMLFFSASLCAADRPVWVIDAKTLNLPQYEDGDNNNEFGFNPRFRIQFSPKDEIMLSFLQRSKQPMLTIRDKPETSGTSFNVLFLSKEDGKLINKAEWPVENLQWFQHWSYGPRIYPLPDNGYVGMFNMRLQVLDSSLNIVRNRLLERLPEPNGYTFSVPLHGTFFVLRKGFNTFMGPYDIIDYSTFEIADNVNDGIIDVWRDKLLIAGRTGNNIDRLFERTIGGAPGGFHLKIDGFRDAKFAHNGAVIVLGHTGGRGQAIQYYWFTIENGETSKPVFVEGEVVRNMVLARNAPVVAIEASRSRAFDRGTTHWVSVYDINTQQRLLQTRTRNEAAHYALSSDGRYLAVFWRTRRTIELYRVPEPSTKK